MHDSRFFRGLKGMLLGCLVGAGVLVPLVGFFKWNFGVAEFLPGAIVGAVLGFILGVCVPSDQPFPRTLTPYALLAMGAFSLWVLADGIVQGEIHGIPNRGFIFSRGFRTLNSWKKDWVAFLLCAPYWGIAGIAAVGVSLWQFLRVSARRNRNDSS